MFRCDAVTCKNNNLCSFTFGFCKLKNPKLEIKTDPETYQEEYTGKCFDYEEKNRID